MEIIILRLGHRIIRDKRLTTHVFLAARALGATRAIYSGERDLNIEQSIRKVVKKFGGSFKVDYYLNYKKVIEKAKKKKMAIIHLTFYGLPVALIVQKIRTKAKNGVLLIVGSEKVQPEVYRYAEFNVSVTNQPHSEVAALAIFLHEFFKGRELEERFQKGLFSKGAKIRIIPDDKKKIVKTF